MNDVKQVRRSTRRETIGIPADANLTGPLIRFDYPTMIARQITIEDDEVTVACVGVMGVLDNTVWRGLIFDDVNGRPGQILHMTDRVIHGDPRTPQEARFPVAIRLKHGVYHVAIQSQRSFSVRVGTGTALSHHRPAAEVVPGLPWGAGTTSHDDYAIYLGCGLRTIGYSDLFSEGSAVITLPAGGLWRVVRVNMPQRTELDALHLFSENCDFNAGSTTAILLGDEDGPAGIVARFITPDRARGWNRYRPEQPTTLDLRPYWIAVRVAWEWSVRGTDLANGYREGSIDGQGRFIQSGFGHKVLPLYLSTLSAKAAAAPVLPKVPAPRPAVLAQSPAPATPVLQNPRSAQPIALPPRRVPGKLTLVPQKPR